eukprot:scaffold1506_cov179-Amphora_coffeaeformis.AAC.13
MSLLSTTSMQIIGREASRRLGRVQHQTRFLSQSSASGVKHGTAVLRPSNLQRRNARLRSSQSNQDATDLPYGLKRVNYSQPPPQWILPPPPPPSKNPIRRYFGVSMLAACTGLFVWIYFNQDESVYEYWKRVEQGDVPLDDDDDDDEDLDLSNVDEWDDKEDSSKGKES